MEIVKVKVVNKGKTFVPEYATEGASGLDVRANIDESITLEPGQRKIIPTGLFVELPVGYEIQIRSRSGLAAKNGILVLNAPGTIDADYRGEIGVILHNSSNSNFSIACGDRIAQMVLQKVPKIDWVIVEELENSDRGSGGFGSTGKS